MISLHWDTFLSFSSLNLRGRYLKAHALGGFQLLPAKSLDLVDSYLKVFILIRLWEVKKFQAQQCLLSGARMRISAGSEISPHRIDRQIAALFCEQEAKDEEDGTYRRSTIEFPLGCRRLTQHL